MGAQWKLCLLIHGLGFLPPFLALGPSERGISNVVSAHPNPWGGAFPLQPDPTLHVTEASFCQSPRTHPKCHLNPLFLVLAQEEAECTPWAGHTQDRAS